MMRDVAGRAVRDVKSVVAPDANAYFERKQVGISSTEARDGPFGYRISYSNLCK